MLIEGDDQRLQNKDIEGFEAEAGIKLPNDYKDFILEFNGGRPSPDVIDVPDDPQSPTDIQLFFGLGSAIRSSDLRWNLELIRDHYPGFFALPIACDSGGNLFCFRVDQGFAKDVIYCDLGSPVHTIYCVASSFAEFLSKLRKLD